MPGAHGFSGLLQGDLGWSFELDQPVAEVVGATVWMTVVVNFAALMFVYLVALPLGHHRRGAGERPDRLHRAASSAISAWRRRTSCWR